MVPADVSTACGSSTIARSLAPSATTEDAVQDADAKLDAGTLTSPEPSQVDGRPGDATNEREAGTLDMEAPDADEEIQLSQALQEPPKADTEAGPLDMHGQPASGPQCATTSMAMTSPAVEPAEEDYDSAQEVICAPGGPLQDKFNQQPPRTLNHNHHSNRDQDKNQHNSDDEPTIEPSHTQDNGKIDDRNAFRSEGELQQEDCNAEDAFPSPAGAKHGDEAPILLKAKHPLGLLTGPRKHNRCLSILLLRSA